MAKIFFFFVSQKLANKFNKFVTLFESISVSSQRESRKDFQKDLRKTNAAEELLFVFTFRSSADFPRISNRVSNIKFKC